MQPAEFTDKLLQNQSLQVEIRKNTIIDGQEGVTVEYRFGGENRFGTFTVVKNAERIFLFGFSSGGFCELPGSPVTEPEAYAHMIESFRFDR